MINRLRLEKLQHFPFAHSREQTKFVLNSTLGAEMEYKISTRSIHLQMNAYRHYFFPKFDPFSNLN